MFLNNMVFVCHYFMHFFSCCAMEGMLKTNKKKIITQIFPLYAWYTDRFGLNLGDELQNHYRLAVNIYTTRFKKKD